MPTVEFHFDVGSPNAYLTHAVLPSIESRTGATFTYVPVLLGGIFKLTNNQPPVTAFGGVRNKLAYQRLEIGRFIRRHGLFAFRMNPHFPVNTLLAMRVCIAAELDGELIPCADALFRAMWEQQARLDDLAVLHGVLSKAGLDSDKLLARGQDQAVKERLAQNTSQSVERGNFGSPTFFMGEDMYFGKDTLPELEQALSAR